jgi:hypothetical protein
MIRFIFFLATLTIAMPICAQWKSIEIGAQVNAMTQYDTFCFISADTRMLRYTKSRGYQYSDNGIDFSHGGVISLASHNHLIYAGTHLDGAPGIVYSSSDSGLQWTSLISVTPIASNGRYLFSTIYSAFGNRPQYARRSSDNGESWDSIAPLDVWRYATNGNCVFATTPKETWRSLNEGVSWSKLSAQIARINSFAFLGSLTLGANDTLVKSTDAGSHWSIVDVNGLKTHVIVCDGKHLFAGTDSGVYVSIDSGRVWTQQNDGMGKTVIVNSLGIYDSFLVVNAKDRVTPNAVWLTAIRPIREMVPPVSAVEQPRAFLDTLSIYPNPTLHSITIESSDELRSIELLDVLGVSKQIVAPRVQKTSLDLSLLPSGTYFLRIETAKGVVFRKVVRE